MRAALHLQLHAERLILIGAHHAPQQRLLRQLQLHLHPQQRPTDQRKQRRQRVLPPCGVVIEPRPQRHEHLLFLDRQIVTPDDFRHCLARQMQERRLGTALREVLHHVAHAPLMQSARMLAAGDVRSGKVKRLARRAWLERIHEEVARRLLHSAHTEQVGRANDAAHCAARKRQLAGVEAVHDSLDRTAVRVSVADLERVAALFRLGEPGGEQPLDVRGQPNEHDLVRGDLAPAHEQGDVDHLSRLARPPQRDAPLGASRRWHRHERGRIGRRRRGGAGGGSTAGGTALDRAVGGLSGDGATLARGHVSGGLAAKLRNSLAPLLF